MEATQAAVGRSTDERKVTHVQCGQRGKEWSPGASHTGMDLGNVMLRHDENVRWHLHNITNVIHATELYFKIVQMENLM